MTKRVQRRAPEPPKGVIIVFVAALGLLIVLSMLPRTWLAALPLGDSGYFWVLLVAGPALTLIGGALVMKVLQVRKTSRWLEVPAKITSSRVKPRKSGMAGDHTAVQNTVEVTFSFDFAGKVQRGSRISLGTEPIGPAAEAALKRYSVGAAVTAYYDPADPDGAVLERDLPADFVKGSLGLVALIAVPIGLITLLVITVRRAMASGQAENAPLALFAGAFGLVLLLFALGSFRRARVAKSWPVVIGKVLTSKTERILGDGDSVGSKRATHAALVEYAYEVNGQTYRSSQITLGVKTSGSLASATALAARYPVGGSVEVHYDPANPGQAALDLSSRMGLIVLVAGLGCLAISAWQFGLFN